MNTQLKLISMATILIGTLAAQTIVPDGTPVKLRLSEPLNSGRNKVGQGVSLTVADDVVVNGKIVIEAGSRATGNVTVADHKRTMGRAGKLDFAPDKVQMTDGRMITLRATEQEFKGRGHGVATGFLTAGIALAFWPAAPVALLIHGKDVEIPAGVTFTSFTDAKFTVSDAPTTTVPAAPTQSSFLSAVTPDSGKTNSSVTISADADGADIEIDGNFVGQVPATMSLSAGTHRVVVRTQTQMWERMLQLTPGNAVNLKAQLESSELRTAVAKSSQHQ